MQKAWILRYGELGLKSRIVRRQFQAGLANNMENLAVQYGVSLVRSYWFYGSSDKQFNCK